MTKVDGQRALKGRPRLKGYLWIGGILMAVVLSVYGFIFINFLAEGSSMVDLNKLLGRYTSGIIIPLALIYFVHSMFNLRADDNTQQAADKAELLAAQQEQKDEADRTYALEVRGVGLAIDEDQQSTIWTLIQKKRNNSTSVYSSNSQDYPHYLWEKEDTKAINIKAAFRGAASEAVRIWPVPAFALGPPKQPEATGAAGDILSGRNAASLASTLFLWQDADNTTHAQNMIERLFQFMDDNPQVPEAFISSRDGDVTRNGHRVPGTPGLQKFGQVVPTIFESTAGLLVSRSDRMDYIRRFASDHGEDNQKKNTDQDKLWYFYWKRSPEFRKVYEDAKRAEGITEPDAPGTMSSAYWHSQLPELWKTLNNRGPGDFKPSPWLPVRWTVNQVEFFDNTPVLGYLHRPIKVSMRDANGKQLNRELQRRELQKGWLLALNTLPKGDLPVRVFYDSTDNIDGEIALTLALHALNTDGHGLETGNVEQGYNLGRRLGNTGVSSALVQINVATTASYKDGGTSAVVYNGSDGTTTIQMVRPPDAARIAKNTVNRGDDPFTFRSPK